MVYYDKEKIRAALIKTVYENNDYDCCRKIGYSDKLETITWIVYNMFNLNNY